MSRRSQIAGRGRSSELALVELLLAGSDQDRERVSLRISRTCNGHQLLITCRQLIPKHARQLAAKPEMWAGKQPSTEQAQQLADACIEEWTHALRQILRHWETPPIVTGDELNEWIQNLQIAPRGAILDGEDPIKPPRKWYLVLLPERAVKYRHRRMTRSSFA